MRSYSRHRTPALPLAAFVFVAGIGVGVAIAPAYFGRDLVADRRPAGLSVETQPASTAPVRGSHAADVLRVIDGDTFEARVHIWPGMDVTTKVRLRGIDAPEMKARCDDESAKAQSARDALVAMLAEGDVRVDNVGLDKYGGRVLADASTRSVQNVSQALLETGLARRYGGGRRETWCP